MEEPKKRLFWMSWYQDTEDHRPLNYPPNDGVLAWWCSGEGEEGYTLCAYVVAEDEEEMLKVVAIDWPELNTVDKLRFAEQRPCVIDSDRFIPPDWSASRLKPWSHRELVELPLKALEDKFSEVIDATKDDVLKQALVGQLARLKRRPIGDITIVDDIRRWEGIVNKSTEQELIELLELN